MVRNKKGHQCAKTGDSENEFLERMIRLAAANKEHKREQGPMFKNKNRQLAEIGDLENEIFEQMIRLVAANEQGKQAGARSYRYHMFKNKNGQLAKIGDLENTFVERIIGLAVANKERKRSEVLCLGTRSESVRKVAISKTNSCFKQMIGLKICHPGPGVFEPDVNISESCRLFFTLQTFSTSRAANNQVHQDIIELSNRWRKLDRARSMK
jgi:hypothetical protein